MRTGLLHAEKSLAHLHHALALTGGAGFDRGAGFGTCAFTSGAFFKTGDANLRLFAHRRFFQRDVHGVAQVVATKDLLATRTLLATGLTKNVPKDVAKRLAKTTKASRTAWTAAHIGVDTCMTKLVVGRTLFRIGKHFIGFLGLFKFHFRRGVTLVAVRVEFHRQFTIRLFDLFVAGGLGYTQYFVEVAFGSHVCI